jgi:hypothetical protein
MELPIPKHQAFKKIQKSIFYLLFYFLSIGLSFLGGKHGNITNKNNQITQNSQVTQLNADFSNPKGLDNTKQQSKNCEPKEFTESEWNLERYNPNKEGYYCPKTSFIDPVMWLKTSMPLDRKRFSIQYQVKKQQKNSNNPLSFILEFGQKLDPSKEISAKNVIPIYKLWTPEGENLQLFRFSKNITYKQTKNPDDSLVPDEAYSLSAPATGESIDSLTVLISDTNSNDVVINFTYNYTIQLPDRLKGISDIVPQKYPVSSF